MTDPQTGAFIWYELMTADAVAATRFYEKVLGWSVAAGGGAPIDYREIKAGDDEHVGGILALSPEMLAGGAKPGWYGYICVADVAAEVAAVKSAGGQVFMEQDIPDVGRMALVADPQGVPFYVMQPQPPADRPDGVSTAFSPSAEGHVAWNELTTSDPAAAKRYYIDRFGWQLSGTMPMPGLGDYEFLSRGEEMIGALMPLPQGKTPGWTFYWRTGDIDAAHTRVEEGGGTPLHEIQQVPGGDFVLTCTDPQGAVFGLVGSRA